VLVFHELSDLSSRTGSTSLAIGNFDGVHLGHQALIRSMLQQAQKEKLQPTVLTFYPHPVEVLKPHKKLERLTTTSEKLSLLESLGVAQVLVAKFDAELANLSPENFFEKYLDKGLKAKSLHVGFNFCFGKDRQGNTETLGTLAAKKNMFLKVEEQVNADGERVASSSIRGYISEGNVSHAAFLLGRPYSITGQVVKGDQRGRTLGFPTANLRCPHDKVLTKNGVYTAQVLWQQELLQAVVNVGIRPTFAASLDPVSDWGPIIEVHLLDFDADIYDEFLTVHFLGRIRDEKKFSGGEELKKQIAEDIAKARASFLR